MITAATLGHNYTRVGIIALLQSRLMMRLLYVFKQEQFSFSFDILWTIIRGMRYRSEKIYSWLLVLTIAISTPQSAMAVEISANMLEGDIQAIQLLVTDASDPKTSGNCPTEHDKESCGESECCITLCNITPMQFPYVLRLSMGTESRRVIVTDCDTITSRHPDLLKRPPKA